MLKSLIIALGDRATLTPEQTRSAVEALVQETIPVEEKVDFLVALAEKGETPEEIAAFVAELRQRSIQPELRKETREGEILDVCGTGGDKLNTFNISTTVAIIAAARDGASGTDTALPANTAPPTTEAEPHSG